MVMDNDTKSKTTAKADSHWDVEMALAVMQDPHADAKTWADAVRWLLVNGPPAIRAHIRQASSTATSAQFPELKPQGYTDGGEPVYDLKALAASLGISEAEAGRRLSDMQAAAGIRTLYQPKETHRVQ
ncbi:MAG: hypothetical protein COX17_11125 [Deltaproteobacteria bacterium CG23_combo_of_CG06-09_8_20_14_all_60_8]|nr:MAG: hypothetical protein COX17_11125 [Deltaproteobacteria bacterium CG23_combo_of_CG06-09_8_20_14_all_60_8]